MPPGPVRASASLSSDEPLLTGRSYAFGTWLFLRLLGVAYLTAFWSLGVQVRGLIGADGMLPRSN